MGITHSKIVSLCSRLRYAIAPPSRSSIAHLIVRVEQGELRGKQSVAKFSRKNYCSFLGVPYAHPPTDDFRFRPPQPSLPWDGIYDATRERWDCPQYDKVLLISYGDEDCLYLNIFTPRPPKHIAKPLPVMVFFHGGGFTFGSGSRKLYGADHLINHDIVFVTVTSRLNVFGFLNLGIEECPGNVGLKDCVYALKWIKRNIRSFGGDADNVTIFGESCGACTVQILMISPLSQGLFTRAILQSGTALVSWACNADDSIETAFRLGKKAGYDGTDARKLVQYLKKLSQGELLRVTLDFLGDLQKERPARFANLPPSVEAIADGAVIPCSIDELINRSKPIPVICGLNNLEGMINMIALDGSVTDAAGENFTNVLKNNFKFNPDLLPELSKRVKKLYVGNNEITRSTARGVINLFSDVIFYRFYDSWQPHLESKTPCYIYNFCYFSRMNWANFVCRFFHPLVAILSDLKGAAHGDEMFFLFYIKLALLYPPVGKANKNMIKLITTMWTNFAKTGNPSTEDVQWNSATSENLCYLEINDKTEMKSGKIDQERTEALHALLDPVANYY